MQLILLANAFFVGSVLMGFEMLGSRYLFPYFGGGIGTWAGLISTVLAALTIGYLVGGAIVDRHPSPRVIIVSCAVAAIYLALVPVAADPLMSGIMNNLGYGPVGILIASACLLLVPLSFLGTFSPVAVRLLLRSTHETGRIAGTVYGVSTIGNIFGTLFTTFYLIPTIGSREITYVYAVVLALCALSLLLVPKAARA
jgi:MFS family permease